LSDPGDTTAIDRYGVVGDPVAHSRSPVIHKLFALQTDQRMQYDLLRASPQELEDTLRRFQREGGKGLNITVPNKAEAVRLVDHLTERASTAGAVNTISFRDGEMWGDNTDGSGLVRDLLDNLRIGIGGSDILILGAGGATRGIIAPLLEQGPARIMIANRTVSKAQALAEHFSALGPVEACRFVDAPQAGPWHLVINATSAGLHGEKPPFPAEIIDRKTVAYDLSYGLNPTPFSLWANMHGAARSLMGWGMLVEQAAESFRIWRGVAPDTAPILNQLEISAS
jgi:shikimate dehydrogenase